jgi:uncharacterized protein (DUF2236 family)
MPRKQNNRVQEYFSVRFRRLLSGDPNGVPPWIEVIAAGDEPGFYLPNEAPWIVHAGFGTLVGGIRALLVQALHPATLAGVADHSRYETDALGRLAGTIRWLTVTTCGSREAVLGEARRVNQLHKRVSGKYQTEAGPKPYRAGNPDLLLWVHVAFMESFLTSHQMYCAEPIPGGADGYISLWSRSVAPLGLSKAPMSATELNEVLNEFVSNGTLRCDDRTREVVKFIRRPPLPPVAKVVYRLLFAAAVVSLREDHRTLLGIKAPPAWLIVGPTRFVLKAIRVIIGPESPIEEAGRQRLVRIGAWAE